MPQDIEWAFSGGKLHLLQIAPPSPICRLQPIELEVGSPTPRPKYLSRRQIVENMPDPICPLFEELYLTEGLESPRKGRSLMVGGGPMFVTLNGYAYQRFDWPQLHAFKIGDAKREPIAEAEIDQAEYEAMEKPSGASSTSRPRARKMQQREQAEHDLAMFTEQLDERDRAAFNAWIAHRSAEERIAVTMPESKNPTFTAFNNTIVNDRQLKEWHEVTQPRLVSIGEKWKKFDPASASDEELLAGIREMGIEEGYYWSSNSGHTFGVAKSTDDQLQCFLREALPDHHFISGQFLSGIESKTMQANADLFEIAQLVRGNEELAWLVAVTPSKFLMDALRNRNDSGAVLEGNRCLPRELWPPRLQPGLHRTHPAGGSVGAVRHSERHGAGRRLPPEEPRDPRRQECARRSTRKSAGCWRASRIGSSAFVSGSACATTTSARQSPSISATRGPCYAPWRRSSAAA